MYITNIIDDPAKAIINADLKIHVVLKKFCSPMLRATAPLIAPPNAPLDNMLASIQIGKIKATPERASFPIIPIYHRSNITIEDASNVETKLGIANLEKFWEKVPSIKVYEKLFCFN